MSTILLQSTPADNSFLPFLKPLLKGHTVHVNNHTPLTLYELTERAKQKGASGIATTDARVLQKLLKQHGEKLPSLDDYAGSIIPHSGIEFLILNPVEQLITTNTGRFLAARYISKLLEPEKWFKVSAFTWEIANAGTLPELYARFSTADLCSIDIETVKKDAAITCVGYCGVWFNNDGTFSTHTIVLPMLDMFNVAWMRKFNLIPAAKIFQNGRYDNAYMLRYHAPVHNWLYDTLNLFHCWYSELPKRLDFISSYLLRSFQYWKDESVAFNLEDYYRYNAKDCWATANAFLAGISEWPEYAKRNYLEEFPLNFPCIQAETTGIKRDAAKFEELKIETTQQQADILLSLQKMVSNKNYNPNSPVQTAKLWEILGCADIKGTGKIPRDKVAHRHPLNKRIVASITKYREVSKLKSSYFKDGITFKGRIIYALDPAGTDTSRLAGKEHHFWCGLSIHVVPRDKKEAVSIKSIYMADNNFLFGEGDYEQAESRDTAYLSGDTALISAVDSNKDFHAANAERFFGVPYDSIIDPTTGETTDKELRDLAKRPNHGANYNMTEGVMLDTMGIENVIRAKKLLKLPPFMTLIQVTKFLLDKFDSTFPVVRSKNAGGYYRYIIDCVEKTHMLVGPTGLTRYCFGNPAAKKPDMNMYAAHPSQSLNAATLNRAWLNVFYRVALKYPRDFKLCAQIHDSILFQYRIGHEHLIKLVRDCMVMTIDVTDCSGITRSLCVPVAMKAGGKHWSEVKTYRIAI